MGANKSQSPSTESANDGDAATGTEDDPVEIEAEDYPAQLERTPTVLVLDRSGSMGDKTQTTDGEYKEKIAQLNNGLEIYKSEISQMEYANKRVDVAIIGFGNRATVEQEFVQIKHWTPPTLDADGGTPMGAAIEKALDLVAEQKEHYRTNGVSVNRPYIWLLTDGKPTDMDRGDQLWNRVQRKLADGTDGRHYEFFALGVSGANMDKLNALVEDPTGRPALKIKEGAFKEFFEFMSDSAAQRSLPESGEAPDLDKDKISEFAETN